MKRSALLSVVLTVLTLGCTEKEDAPVTLVVSSELLTFGPHGGEGTIDVTCNYEWTTDMTEGCDEWLQIVSREPVEGEAAEGKITRVTVKALENATDAIRSGYVYFNSRELERRAGFSQIAATFNVAPTLDFDSKAGEMRLSVSTNLTSWEVAIEPGEDDPWCSARADISGRRIVVTASSDNESENPRSATLKVTAMGRTLATVTVSQEAKEIYYEDRQVVRLQSSGKGRGVHLVFMGDGYTEGDMKAGKGKYETDMRAGMEHFFSVYPYSEYRDYFDVWMVAAVSQEAGMSEKGGTTVNTVFKTVWDGGRSTAISCNYTIVQNYTRAMQNHPEAGNPSQNNITVVMPINRNVYAGTCLMWTSGYSISMCPVGPYYGNILVHEAGGHGFAKLHDEYIFYNFSILADRPEAKEQLGYLKELKKLGHRANADLHGNIEETSWAGFAGNPKYSMVDTWEGALFAKDIWRPERFSCMDDNRLYFNAPSRWAQVKRTLELAGVPYSFEQFMEDDVVPAVAMTRGWEQTTHNTTPLGLPVMMD